MALLSVSTSYRYTVLCPRECETLTPLFAGAGNRFDMTAARSTDSLESDRTMHSQFVKTGVVWRLEVFQTEAQHGCGLCDLDEEKL
jgi:hypothetical protein